MDSNPDSFNDTLISNSSTKAYPNSTIGAFTVQLAHEIRSGYRQVGSVDLRIFLPTA